MYQGGNMWGMYDCYLSAGRDILGLELPIHDKFKYWEEAAIQGGFRIMHPDFCMVSDFPQILKKDERNRPHSDNGPSHRWRDGLELYYVHGVKVTKQIVDTPETLTVKQIEQEENSEVRRVMIERFGQARFLQESGAKAISTELLGGREYTLYRKEVNDDEPILMVRCINATAEPDGTFHKYFIRVPPDTKTALSAVAWTFGIKPKQYAPVMET
jgi:hypothetical protein